MLVGCATQRPTVHRFGQIAKIRPDKIERFKELSDEMWPEVSEALKEHGIRNSSIYLKDLKENEYYLFRYFEYAGKDLDGDTSAMAEDPTVEKWKTAVGNECLGRISPDDASWWVDMEEVFYYDGAADARADESRVQRYGQVIGVRPEMVESYKYIHANTWPEVLAAIKKGNIRNYPIYMTKIEDEYYIFGYFEYVGDDFEADMAMIDAEPATKAWIKFTDDGCQLPIPTRAEGEWWANMEQVFVQK
jgi:L-rhamnose mutarotase